MKQVICWFFKHKWRMDSYGMPRSDPPKTIAPGVMWAYSGGFGLYVPTTWKCTRCGATKETKERWD